MTNRVVQPTPPIPAPFQATSYGAGSMVVDRAGTIFQVWTGRLTNPGPWGSRVFRTVKGGRPELVWFIEDANVGVLFVMNKQLFLPYQPPKGVQHLQQIHGYIDPSDEPSSSVVDVNESALNSIKQSVNVAQTTANAIDYKAARALNMSQTAQATADKARAEIAALQARVNALQTQNVNVQQITEIVWTKLWDVLYLLRMGMNPGFSKDPNIQGWIHDLTSFIKKVK